MGVSTINSQLAGQQIYGIAQKINGRITPPIEAYKLRQMEENQVHVFSVCRWAHPRPMGDWGTFILPAKPKDAEYAEFTAVFPFYKSERTAIPGIMMEPRNMDGVENVWHEEDGLEWAYKLIEPYMKYGVFIGSGPVPTRAELSEANINARRMYEFFVEEARQMSADPLARRSIQVCPHHEAAQELGIDEPWTKAQDAKESQKCPMCGKVSEAGVVLCANHEPAYYFDVEAYKKIVASQEAALKGK